ncbi:DUF4055 domain-containing protein [Yersinia enterocolitica]|uniref:DUF4055 domain-containing protein n=1 Tax=Yersinia enterocolitica TaxID=630 RepID=UPI003F46029C
MADISTPNLDYNNMLEAWEINDALMGGTLYMRTQQQYMPRWPNEADDSYRNRLAVATLLPVYRETISNNIGRVFAEPTRLSEDTPDPIVEYCKNIDLEGSRLDVWAQEYFSHALQYGLAHALVDYPKAPKVKTVAEKKALNLRPYVTLINPRQVIGWRSEISGGKRVLTELRIKEIVIKDNHDYSQEKIAQIRRYTIGKVELYRRTASRGGEKLGKWVKVDGWKTSRDDIPLVTLYTHQIGFMRGTPPLIDLAMLNIKHWQSQSEQDNILHVARVPLLSVFGLEDKEELTVGASVATRFDDRTKQGLEYTEHSGASIEAGRQSIEDLEAQMRMAGAKLLQVNNTATKGIDQVGEERLQEQSPLYTMANSLEDALDNILQIMAEWIGEPTGGAVDVRTELDVREKQFNTQAAVAIQTLRQGGSIRMSDSVRVLQDLNIIDPEAKPEEVEDELRNETIDLSRVPNEAIEVEE